MNDFLKIKNLSLNFGGLKALKNLSFELKKGEIYSVIGPNGAGKTSLFNCINGIYSPSSKESKIIFKDKEIQGNRPDQIARLGIGRTFQNVKCFTHMTVIDNIMVGKHIFIKAGLFRNAFMWGLPSFTAKEEIKERKDVEEIIEYLSLTDVRDFPIGMLPYHYQKLAEIGRVLAQKPELILLDEPFAGLDPNEKKEMIIRIKNLPKDLSTTVLMIEHDMNIVMEISHRILVVNFGEKIADGLTNEVRINPMVLKAYLGDVFDVKCG